MEKSQNKKTSKYTALVTYVIAVICLIAGLLLPLTSGGDSVMLALQLPEVFKAVSGQSNSFALSYPIDLLGTGLVTVDIMAWVILLYSAITALGVVLLIPVLASKKYSKVPRVIAYIVEITAVCSLSVYLIMAMQYFGTATDVNAFKFIHFGLLAAWGGALLMLIIQTLTYKKGTGVAKVFLLLLSVGAVFVLYDIAAIISQMYVTWPKIASMLNASSLMYGDVYAIGYVKTLFEGPIGDNIVDALAAAPDFKQKAVLILTVAVAVMVILNYFIDLISMGTNAKHAGYSFNVVRYTFVLILLVCLYIFLAVCGYQFGLLLYLLTLAVLIQFIISVARSSAWARKKKKAKLYKSDKPESLYTTRTPEAESAYLPVAADKAPEPAPSRPVAAPAALQVQNTPQPQNAPQAGASQTENAAPADPVKVYTINAVYQGPADSFIRKLTNDEKIEFAMTFIEKSKGDLGNIPDYVIGGNNKKFFSAVFIYLGKVRSMISDGLLNKMYKELNML